MAHFFEVFFALFFPLCISIYYATLFETASAVHFTMKRFVLLFSTFDCASQFFAQFYSLMAVGSFGNVLQIILKN